MLSFDRSDQTEKLGLTSTELIFSSRSVRNVTVTRPSASGIPSTPLYVIETLKKTWADCSSRGKEAGTERCFTAERSFQVDADKWVPLMDRLVENCY